MAMLFMPKPLPLSDLDTWVRPDPDRKYEVRNQYIALVLT